MSERRAHLMRHATVATLLLVRCLVAGAAGAGCQSVHTERADGVPVAMWLAVQSVDRAGQPAGPDDRQTVARVLADAGLHPTLDDAGVSVPATEERRAREVLLTDRRLAGSRVFVFLTIPAGSGRKTPAGFEVPQVAPDEPMRTPAPSR